MATMLGCSSEPGQEGPEPRHPFGTHAGYWSEGVIFPSNPSRAELDEAVGAFYREWKRRYFVSGCAAGQAYIKAQTSSGAWIVSEGQGYGMLVAALMAGYEPDAKSMFDQLYRYYVAHPSVINGNLMSWAQDGSCKNIDSLGSASATDGDVDAAYGLLLADAQWGSDGEIDYLGEARRIMGAILASEVQPANTVLFGDWVTDSSHPNWDATRSSDFITAEFKAFAEAAGEARWNAVVDKAYAMVEYLQAVFAPQTGLLPDFIVDVSGAAPRPAPPNYLEGENDGRYSYNACRTPWRLATDFLVSGDARSRAAIRQLNAWVRDATGGDPQAITSGYDLDGTALNSDVEAGFIAPFMVAAMVEPESGTNQPWLDALWDEVASRPAEEYYSDSVKLLCMLVTSGNWWTP
ncbi:MAG: hypothetical protein GYA21_06155 [Myxococcales bacterium]|nr:hypothetical protein [Myxococcales bacterium]